jgi:hypothetical protein
MQGVLYRAACHVCPNAQLAKALESIRRNAEQGTKLNRASIGEKAYATRAHAVLHFGGVAMRFPNRLQQAPPEPHLAGARRSARRVQRLEAPLDRLPRTPNLQRAPSRAGGVTWLGWYDRGVHVKQALAVRTSYALGMNAPAWPFLAIPLRLVVPKLLPPVQCSSCAIERQTSGSVCDRHDGPPVQAITR